MHRLLALAALALLGLPAIAQPVTFYGQDSRTPPQGGPFVIAGAAPDVARRAFLSNLDPATITNASFESETTESSLPSGTTSFPFTATFSDNTGTPSIIATGDARGGRFIDNPAAGSSAGGSNGNPLNGIYATAGDVYLFVRGEVTFDFGATPIHAFGFYINDVETLPLIELTLTPSDGGPNVVLLYGPVRNNGRTGQVGNGEGQLNFVGVIDKATSYSAVTVGFPGQQNTEGFGFDELVVGDLAQVVAEQQTVTQAEIADEPGWRLLSVPLYNQTVNALALQNLVQGVPGASGVQQQYPSAGPNLYQGYNGGGRYDYIPAENTAKELVPGRGIWWYWYDFDLQPDPAAAGGGTSASVLLDDFLLTGLGFEIAGDTTLVFPDNTNCASDGRDCTGEQTPNGDPTDVGAPAGTVSPADDDFYMIGNPYARPLAMSAITATGGTLSDAAFIWNPSNLTGQTPNTGGDPEQDGPGSYEVVFQTPPDAIPDSIAVWQGLLAEVTKTPVQVGQDVAFMFAIAGSQGSGTPPFYGREVPEPYIHFSLSGTLASGAEVRDAAAYVRFRADASADVDRYDASKPLPPVSEFALLAPVGMRDSEPTRHAVLALPEMSGRRSVPLAFTAGAAGTYRITWEGERFDASLTDHLTGEVIALLPLESYTFESDATDWTERFTLDFAMTVAAETQRDSELYVSAPTPNPTSDGFRIDVRLGATANATLSLYDMLGRSVREYSITPYDARSGDTLTVETTGLAPGAYMVVVETPGARETRRVTVLR